VSKLFQLALDFFTPHALSEPAQPATPSSLPQPAPVTPDLDWGRTEHPGIRHPRANRHIVLDGVPVGYHHQVARRKTIGMLVGIEGLEVRSPRWVGKAEVEAALRERAAWILRKLNEVQAAERRRHAQAIDWADQALVPYLGQHLRLVIDPARARSAQPLVACNDDAPAQWHLHLALPQQASAAQIRDATQAWLMAQARQLFTQRLNHFAPALGVGWTQLSLSSAATRWGSAGADGRIRLNWRLIHFKPSVIDYVVAHELSHLRVMNHSPQFWETVASVMPDYREQQQTLKRETIPPWA